MKRPRIFVLAGVNGAGKSSIGGEALRRSGLSWFNPDTFTRHLIETTGAPLHEANAAAWQEGLERLQNAIANGSHYAFETTLGGNTIAATLQSAAASHDVMMWFCGLDSPEHHIARVRFRVTQGGHDIPEAKIRERYIASIQNLIALLPALAHLQVYDNSIDAVIGKTTPDPQLILQLKQGHITWPTHPEELRHTPDWAKPIVEAALQMQG